MSVFYTALSLLIPIFAGRDRLNVYIYIIRYKKSMTAIIVICAMVVLLVACP